MRTLKSQYMALWYSTGSEFDLKRDKISLEEKIEYEKKIESFRKNLLKKSKYIPSKDEEENFKNEIILEIKNFESSLSPYKNSLIDFFIDNGYGQVTEDFIEAAEKFDPNMDVMDIFQAIRNVWIIYF